MTEISFLPFYSADATTKLARALFTNAKVSFILFLFSQAKRYSLITSIFLRQNFVDRKIRIIFAYEFIPHLREGNRKTQAIEALRFLLL